MKNLKIVQFSFVFLIGMLFSTAGTAQRRINGIVHDATTNSPLGGATITLKNSKTHTIADAGGKFALEVPDGETVLIVSFVGYNTQNLAVDASETNVVVKLIQSSNNELNQVVVVGYGTQAKKDLTGSVAVVNVKNMVKQPTALVTDLLQGQASGVTVIESGQPGEDPQIRIRGINTFGNNVPLFVVDGVPTQNISDLNPNDIASMQVLKDAGAASIYGSRASNGVIIITTKSGNGRVEVHYDAYYGSQIPKSGNVWNRLNPQEQANYDWESQKANGVIPSSPIYGNGATPVLPDYIDPLAAHEGDPSVDPSKYYVNPNYISTADLANFYYITKANKSGTDWFHKIFKSAPISNNNVSLSGSNENAKYLVSLDYFNQQGTLINTYLKRYTIRSNSTFNVTKNIIVGENVSYSLSHSPNLINFLNPSSGGSPIFSAYQMPEIIPVHDIKGNYAGTVNTPNWTAPNPVAVMQRTSNDANNTNRLFGNVFTDIHFLQNFTFHSSFGGENRSGFSHRFLWPTYEARHNESTSQYFMSSYTTYDWTWTNTLTFNKSLPGNSNINVMVGTEADKSEVDNMSGSTTNFFSFNPNYVTLSSGSGIKTNGSSRTIQSLSSLFGRVDYAYNSKYLLSGTIRRDGSSKFVNDKYGLFPSFSAGWRVSQEGFMKNISWLQDLKIRGSWGIMGNQFNVNADNGFYTYLSSNTFSYYDIGNTNNTLAPGLSPGQIGNPNASWEKDINSNIGIDATILNGRISLTADYYQKNITGLLYNPALLGTQGAGTAPFVNIGQMSNKGFDLSLSGNTKISRNLQLNASLNFTSYKNLIEKVADNTNFFWTTDQRQFGSFFIRNQVGHPVGSFYSYKVDGFWNSTAEIQAADILAQKNTGNPSAIYQTGEKIGYFRYADVNGDGQITPDDRTFVGNPNPKFTYGINFNVTYKAFDISFFFYGVYGNQIWNNLLLGDLNGSSKTSLYDHWTPENYNAKAPLPGTYGYQGDPLSYFVENGSYLRLKNFQVGYTIPANKLKSIGIHNLRVYAQAANLFTITKYTGVDPEVGGTVTYFGMDQGIYPTQKQFLIGGSLNF